MASTCGPTPMKSDDDYRAESDHGTLSRAQEIQSDPSRMAGARKYHAKQVRTLTKVGRAIGVKRAPTAGGR